MGYAQFNGPEVGVAGAIVQAKKVGAAAIVVSAQYARTVSGVLPLTLPQSSTTVANGTVTAVGTNGQSAVGSYTGTATTYGTQTTYVPYSVDRYDQRALFFAQLSREGVGLMMDPLSPEQARAIGTGKAVSIRAVRAGSPAFLADVLPGDFLVSINGQPVYDLETFHTAIAMRGKLSLVLIRNGSQKVVDVVVPDGTW